MQGQAQQLAPLDFRVMREMAADPQIQAECKAIEHAFAPFELDGLDPPLPTPPPR